MRNTRLRAAAQDHAANWAMWPVAHQVPGHGVVLVGDHGGIVGSELCRADTEAAAIAHYGREASLSGIDYATPGQRRGHRWGIGWHEDAPPVQLQPFHRKDPPCVGCGKAKTMLTLNGVQRGTTPGRLCEPCNSRAWRLGVIQAFPHLAQRRGDLPVPYRPASEWAEAQAEAMRKRKAKA